MTCCLTPKQRKFAASLACFGPGAQVSLAAFASLERLGEVVASAGGVVYILILRDGTGTSKITPFL